MIAGQSEGMGMSPSVSKVFFLGSGCAAPPGAGGISSCGGGSGCAGAGATGH